MKNLSRFTCCSFRVLDQVSIRNANPPQSQLVAVLLFVESDLHFKSGRRRICFPRMLNFLMNSLFFRKRTVDEFVTTKFDSPIQMKPKTNPFEILDTSLHTASTVSGQQLAATSSLTQAASSSHSMLTLATTSSPTKLANSYTKQPLTGSTLQHLSPSTGSAAVAPLQQPTTLLNGQLLSPSEKQASKLPSNHHHHHHHHHLSTNSPFSAGSTLSNGPSSSLYGHKVHPQPTPVINTHDRPLSPAAAIASGAIKGPPSTPPNITIGTTTDPSCDSYGVCYQVSLRCTDSRILVQVRTSQPFHGRIYALGRSETCNNKIHNAQHFSLEMSLTGQDCNTQSVQGVYSNTVVLQHHNVVLTKADKVRKLFQNCCTCSSDSSTGKKKMTTTDLTQSWGVITLPSVILPFDLDSSLTVVVILSVNLIYRKTLFLLLPNDRSSRSSPVHFDSAVKRTSVSNDSHLAGRGTKIHFGPKNAN